MAIGWGVQQAKLFGTTQGQSANIPSGMMSQSYREQNREEVAEDKDLAAQMLPGDFMAYQMQEVNRKAILMQAKQEYSNAIMKNRKAIFDPSIQKKYNQALYRDMLHEVNNKSMKSVFLNNFESWEQAQKDLREDPANGMRVAVKPGKSGSWDVVTQSVQTNDGEKLVWLNQNDLLNPEQHTTFTSTGSPNRYQYPVMTKYTGSYDKFIRENLINESLIFKPVFDDKGKFLGTERMQDITGDENVTYLNEIRTKTDRYGKEKAANSLIDNLPMDVVSDLMSGFFEDLNAASIMKDENNNQNIAIRMNEQAWFIMDKKETDIVNKYVNNQQLTPKETSIFSDIQRKYVKNRIYTKMEGMIKDVDQLDSYKIKDFSDGKGTDPTGKGTVPYGTFTNAVLNHPAEETINISMLVPQDVEGMSVYNNFSQVWLGRMKEIEASEEYKKATPAEKNEMLKTAKENTLKTMYSHRPEIMAKVSSYYKNMFDLRVYPVDRQSFLKDHGYAGQDLANNLVLFIGEDKLSKLDLQGSATLLNVNAIYKGDQLFGPAHQSLQDGLFLINKDDAENLRIRIPIGDEIKELTYKELLDYDFAQDYISGFKTSDPMYIRNRKLLDDVYSANMEKDILDNPKDYYVVRLLLANDSMIIQAHQEESKNKFQKEAMTTNPVYSSIRSSLN